MRNERNEQVRVPGRERSRYSRDLHGDFSHVKLFQHGAEVVLVQAERDRSVDADIDETPYLALDAELMDAVCLAWLNYRGINVRLASAA